MTTDELSRLFAAERAVRPSARLTQRGLTRFLTDFVAQTAPAPALAVTETLGWSSVVKWLLLGVAIGVSGSGVAAYTLSERPVDAPSPAPPVVVAPPPAAVVAPERAPSVAPQPVLPSGTAPPAHFAASPAADGSGTSSFDAELRLIKHAKAELDAGNAALARPWLAEHAARFPHGTFAVEREALEVMARCSAQRDPAQARRFAARYPASAMNPRLSMACALPNNFEIEK